MKIYITSLLLCFSICFLSSCGGSSKPSQGSMTHKTVTKKTEKKNDVSNSDKGHEGDKDLTNKEDTKHEGEKEEKEEKEENAVITTPIRVARFEQQCLAILEAGYGYKLRTEQDAAKEKLNEWLCDNSEEIDSDIIETKNQFIKSLKEENFPDEDTLIHYKSTYCKASTEKTYQGAKTLFSYLPELTQDVFSMCAEEIHHNQPISCVIWTQNDGKHVFIDILPNSQVGAGSAVDIEYTFSEPGLFFRVNEALPQVLNADNMKAQSEDIQRALPLTVSYPRRIMLQNSAPQDKTKKAEITITGFTEYERRPFQCKWSWSESSI